MSDLSLKLAYLFTFLLFFFLKCMVLLCKYLYLFKKTVFSLRKVLIFCAFFYLSLSLSFSEFSDFSSQTCLQKNTCNVEPRSVGSWEANIAMFQMRCIMVVPLHKVRGISQRYWKSKLSNATSHKVPQYQPHEGQSQRYTTSSPAGDEHR